MHTLEPVMDKQAVQLQVGKAHAGCPFSEAATTGQRMANKVEVPEELAAGVLRVYNFCLNLKWQTVTP
jgi:hypothetical protein